MKKNYPEEILVMNLANTIPEVSARLASADEDHGYKKADVVLNHKEKDYFFQVSRQPKSKKQIKKMFQRGTYAIYTNDFFGNEQKNNIINSLESVLGAEKN
ncbi:MAG: hypothetical protein AABX88_02865 [Nanoarchaeota archaeon]